MARYGGEQDVGVSDIRTASIEPTSGTGGRSFWGSIDQHSSRGGGAKTSTLQRVRTTAGLMMPRENETERKYLNPSCTESWYLFKKVWGRIWNKAFLSRLLDSKTAVETRWPVMGTIMQGNVCNHGIVRRFGHSQDVAYVQVGKRSNLNLWILLFWKGDVGIVRLGTRSVFKVDILGSHTHNFHTGSLRNMLTFSSPVSERWLSAHSLHFNSLNSRLIVTVPASIQTWHQLLIWGKRVKPPRFNLLCCSCT